MAQNTSSAVMAQRREPHDSLDYFPTPPWATRALFEHAVMYEPTQRFWEPACGDGSMYRALSEYFRSGVASDVHDYGWGHIVHDFLQPYAPVVGEVDWIVTNPPFRLAEQFIERGFAMAKVAVAMFVRTSFVESVSRYESLFRDRPPQLIAQFVERVPLVKGRIDPNISSATSYCWLVWVAPFTERAPLTQLGWIPPCRAQLERPGDYPLPAPASVPFDTTGW